jgi:hypothetical protein
MRSNWGKCLINVLAILAIALFAMAVGAELLIGSGVRSFSQTAQAHFPRKNRRQIAHTAAGSSASKFSGGTGG